MANRLKVDIVTPALAQRDKRVLDAKAEMAPYSAVANAELWQLENKLEIMAKAGPNARKAYLLGNFDKLFEPFAKTLASYPASGSRR